MVVLHTCKNEKVPIKKLRCKGTNKIICRFFRRSRAANSEVSGGILPQFELIKAYIVVLLTCKNEKDPIKNEGARVLTSLLFDFSDAQGQLTPKSVVEFRQNSNSSKLL